MNHALHVSHKRRSLREAANCLPPATPSPRISSGSQISPGSAICRVTVRRPSCLPCSPSRSARQSLLTPSAGKAGSGAGTLHRLAGWVSVWGATCLCPYRTDSPDSQGPGDPQTPGKRRRCPRHSPSVLRPVGSRLPPRLGARDGETSRGRSGRGAWDPPTQSSEGLLRKGVCVVPLRRGMGAS